MSSYVTSPFVLEEQRLQGIVQQCSQDLDRALEKVLEQQQIMLQRQTELREKEIQYHEGINKEAFLYSREQSIEKRKVAEKRKELKETLATVQIELNAYAKSYGSLESATKRQSQLMSMLEAETADLYLIEKKIQEHIKASELEMGKNIAVLSSSNKSSDMAVSRTRRGQTGVSLKEGAEDTKVRNKKKSPLDIFDAKLERALSSPFSGRLPELQRLKKEMDKQPDYAKLAFSIKNMKKLDALLARIAGLEKQKQSSQSQQELLVFQYKAICSLLGEEPDVDLISDERSHLKLQQVYEEKLLFYQEKKKNEYISHAVRTVLERHGIVFYEAGDGTDMRFSLENAQLNVSGSDVDSLSMEVIGEYSGEAPTLDDIRKSTSTAKKFCSLLSSIESELAEEYGIVLKKVVTLPPSEEHIAMKKKNVHTSKKYHTRKKSMSI